VLSAFAAAAAALLRLDPGRKVCQLPFEALLTGAEPDPVRNGAVLCVKGGQRVGEES